MATKSSKAAKSAIPTKKVKKSSKIAQLSGKVQSLEEIRKALGRNATHKSYGVLDLGDPELNTVLGCEDGIPWGTMIELFGPNSQGKTALSMDILATAQAEGAFGVWLDFEKSFEKKPSKVGRVPWPIKRGIDVAPDKFELVQPYINEATSELSSAEDLLQEGEIVIRSRAKTQRVFVVLDSIAAMLPEQQGIEDMKGSMRGNMALASLLSTVLRRWVGLFGTLGVSIILINQIRTNPNQMFGNPEYTPGGNAPAFYSQVRARIKRQGVGKGRMTKNGRVIGIKSLLTNMKNKAGGEEGSEVGYKIYHSGKSVVVPADEIKKESIS